MTILKKTLEWLLPNHHLQKHLKYYLQNLHIFAGKNIVINFKITNLKIKITFKKTKIMLLADTNQTLHIQKCKNIIKQTNK